MKHRVLKSIVLSLALSIISQTSVRAALSQTGKYKSSIGSPTLVIIHQTSVRLGKSLRVDNGPLRVLGIDPGLTRMGYGVVQETRGKLEALACGTLTTSPTQQTSTRLMMLFEQLRLVLNEWRPDMVACERLFFAANALSAVPAVQASGIALLLAAQSGLQVTEYTPLQVKQAVVGNGTATKKQVQYMVERLVGGFPAPDSADAADALGVAITHLSSRRLAGLTAAR